MRRRDLAALNELLTVADHLGFAPTLAQDASG
jgi:hypothetical protein